MSLLGSAIEWVSAHPGVFVALLLVLCLTPLLNGLYRHLRVYWAFRSVPGIREHEHPFFGHSPWYITHTHSGLVALTFPTLVCG